MTRTNRGTDNRKGGGRRKGSRPHVDPAEFWNPVPQLPDLEPISLATDPTVVVRSLGDLPLHDHGQRTAHEINRVLVRSSLLAGALAELAGVLEDPGEPDVH
jgi:hypothetical protein